MSHLRRPQGKAAAYLWPHATALSTFDSELEIAEVLLSQQ